MGSGSRKTNPLINMISWETDIDKVYLFAKNPKKAKYQLLINKLEKRGSKHFNDFKAFVEYSNDMNDIFKNTEEYNLNKNCKISIMFDDVKTDMFSNKKIYPIVTEWFITCKKLNISLVFIRQSYFYVPKDIRLNSTHYFIIKMSKNKNLHKLHLIISQIDF